MSIEIIYRYKKVLYYYLFFTLSTIFLSCSAGEERNFDKPIKIDESNFKKLIIKNSDIGFFDFTEVKLDTYEPNKDLIFMFHSNIKHELLFEKAVKNELKKYGCPIVEKGLNYNKTNNADYLFSAKISEQSINGNNVSLNIQWYLYDSKEYKNIYTNDHLGDAINVESVIESYKNAISDSFRKFLNNPLLITAIESHYNNRNQIIFSNTLNHSITINSKKINKSVFQIIGDNVSGSGFLINSDGYALTNEHVISNNPNVHAVFSDGTKEIVTVIAQNQMDDLALIKIRGENYEYLPLARLDEISISDEVIAIGTPSTSNFLNNTITKGIVSGIREKDGNKYIQTDAAINPGNSGGPLVGKDGKVYGIVTTKKFDLEGLGFAVPSEKAIVLFNLIENSYKVIVDTLKNNNNTIEDEPIEIVSKNIYKISYKGNTLGYLELPLEIDMVTLYVMKGEEPIKGSSVIMKDSEGNDLNMVVRNNFLKRLGNYINQANNNNLKLIISAHGTNAQWYAANLIRFGKTIEDIDYLELLTIWHPILKKTFDMQGWINY